MRELFAPGRERCKTRYVRWDRIDRSRRSLAASIPGFLLWAGMGRGLDQAVDSVVIVDVETLGVVIAAHGRITLVRFQVVLASVVRMPPGTSLALAIGTFSRRETTT